MQWTEFIETMALEMAGLETGSILIVAEPKSSGGRYVQCRQLGKQFYAEVVANCFLPDTAHASEEGQRVIADAGWKAGPEWAEENWSFELNGHKPVSEYRTLATMMATALRDGYGVPDLTGWYCEAWNESNGNEPVELDFLPLPSKPNA
ncbi:hypothetical protein BJF79_36235 [Actinomadura sp. CNU-125]|uniref:TY-Chap domain-containing protein n=1 Tax=Actinomadura sp. CNU-125 TaxID=1904961 RepID=UPI00095A682C|nr:hypothetical protein [Actinomadura sp. CNU-125]OLT32362.1 hypothetical protein BJF79_36235 [Actinomadura sp. CNU-125]